MCHDILPSTRKMPYSVDLPQAIRTFTAFRRIVLRKKSLIYVVSGLGSESN